MSTPSYYRILLASGQCSVACMEFSNKLDYLESSNEKMEVVYILLLGGSIILYIQYIPIMSVLAVSTGFKEQEKH